MYLSQLSFDVSEHVKDYCFHWLQLFSVTQMIVVECKEPKEEGYLIYISLFEDRNHM